MTTTKRQEDIILAELKQQQEDLHLLFMNDVTTMDITFYNEICLALTKCQIDITTAKENYEARLAGIRPPWRTQEE